jgi:MFS transporter, ACDE family, multidrug resistance protein
VRRLTVVLLFGAIFAAELGWAGISPLLPSFRDRYGLTDVASGLIVSVASVGILVVSLPASGLTNRFSVRTLTLWSLGALAAGNLGVGMSSSYAGLLTARLVFGAGLGTMWVTGTAWLHDAAGEDGPRALALTTSIVGAASLIGPALTGALGERYSLGTPFVVLGAIVLLVLVLLAMRPPPSGRATDAGPPLGEMLRAARGDLMMRSGLVLTLAVALMWMSAELLVPLRLADHGFGASRIGLAFSAASIVFVVASALTSARAERYATIRISAVWTAVFGACVLIAVTGVTPLPTVAFLVTMGLTTGVLVALTYPLGVRRRGADQPRLGDLGAPGPDDRRSGRAARGRSAVVRRARRVRLRLRVVDVAQTSRDDARRPAGSGGIRSPGLERGRTIDLALGNLSRRGRGRPRVGARRATGRTCTRRRAGEGPASPRCARSRRPA